MSSKQPSNKPSRDKSSNNTGKVGNKWILGLLILCFIGFSVSTYLTAKHYLGEVPACSVIEGCEEVTSSEYATLGPFPISLFGLLYFLSLGIILVAYLDMKKMAIFNFFVLISLPGALISSTLLWLQFGVLKAVCVYCLAADISVLLITASAVFLYYTFRQAR